MNKSFNVLLCIIIAGVFILTGCGLSDDSSQSKNYTSTSNILNTTNVIDNTKKEGRNTESASYGTYNGNPYEVVNNNIPYFTAGDKQRTDAFESYSDLDSKGRCGVAYANICKELMPTEKRGKC